MGFGPLSTGPANHSYQRLAGSGHYGSRKLRLSRAVCLEWKAETLTATRSLRLTDLIRSAGLGTRLTPGCNSPTLWHPRLPNNSPLTDGSNRAGLSVVQIVHLTLITVRGRGTLCTAKLTNQADCLVLLFCLLLAVCLERSDLDERSERYAMEVMQFGKFRGMMICDIPTDYLQWGANPVVEPLVSFPVIQFDSRAL